MSAAGDNSRQGGVSSEDERFEAELHFVQCLALPSYLCYLANGPLDDPRFVKYLAYLHGYWTRPEYACYLEHPQCLFYLKMLQEPEFRLSIKNWNFCTDMWGQQVLHWKHGETGDFVRKKFNQNNQEEREVVAKAGTVARFVGKKETK